VTGKPFIQQLKINEVGVGSLRATAINAAFNVQMAVMNKQYGSRW